MCGYILIKAIEDDRGNNEVFIVDAADLVSTLIAKVNEAVDDAKARGCKVKNIMCVYATHQVVIEYPASAENKRSTITYSIFNVAQAKIKQFPIYGYYREE